MKKIQFITNTEESWERRGKFDPPLLEVSIMYNEILFDIGTKDEINELKSKCIYLSQMDAKRLLQWLYDLDFIPYEE